MKWVWIILAIAYVLSRIDLIPDVFVGWGWIDDIVVLILLYRYLAKIRRASTLFQQNGSTRQQARTDSQAGPSNSRSTSPKSAYETLEVSPDASQEEIRTAYRRLANQYHPDKVAHLGKEFQELANQRFKEIQEAYQQLR